MYVKQRLSILLLLKRKKIAKDGKIPIYVRITIDGKSCELALGCMVSSDDWDGNKKEVRSGNPEHGSINKKIIKTKSDIERHFELMQTKNVIASAEMVKQSYLRPYSEKEKNAERQENIQLSKDMDILLAEYLSYCNKVKRAYADGNEPSPERLERLKREKSSVEKMISAQVKKANRLFDNKWHEKTFLLILNEYLLNFLELAFADHRSPNTLEKLMGKKKRYIEFLKDRYDLEDISLSKIEHKFIDELFKYLLVRSKVKPNTAMKYAQFLKEVMDRAVAKGWINSNVFVIFKCRYTDPNHDWLTMQELERLKATDFGEEKLNIIRDLFLFSSFTGLSYQEVHTLKPADIIIGVDGKSWINKSRKKTGGDETLPLLPLPLQILGKYKDHPLCLKRGCLLPVPTNEQYNRCLKEIGKIGNFNVVLKTHKSRYFFANEVTYDNGVPLKTVSKMLGHKSVKTTEVYVRANRKNISENMDMVEKKLFGEKGRFQSIETTRTINNDFPDGNSNDPEQGYGARVIRMGQSQQEE